MNLLLQSALTVVVAHAYQVGVSAQTLSEVVVSASRAEQRSFDTPAAIQSISRDTIENAGPQVNLSESLNRVPGLTILNRQNYAQDLQVSIRGFGARSPFGIRGIRLLVDGIPATTPDGQGQGSSISLTSTDRIEVLRGPLAQLYGNSSGGVIQAFTREAPEQPELSAQHYSGSFGLRRSDWQYAGRVGDYGLVADYSTFDTDGFRDNSRTKRKQFNSKLQFSPSEKTRMNVVFNHFDMPLAEDPAGLKLEELSTPRIAGTNTTENRVRKITSQNQLGASLTHALDATRSLTARAYYGERDNLQFQANNFWVGLDRSYYGAGLQYNQKTTLANVPVSWVAGYEFDRSRERRQGGAAINGEKTPGLIIRNEVNEAQNSDFFANATALVTDSVSLVAGLRRSILRFTSSDDYLVDGDGSGRAVFRATSPVLGLTYHASETINLYANYGKGFESPTLAEVAYRDSSIISTPPLAKFNPDLQASSSQHYEIGAKWAPNPRTRLDFTVFRINASDEIVVSTNRNGRSAFKNVPGTQRTGWELSGSTSLTPHWQATLAASSVNAEYSQAFTSIVVGTSITTAAGNKLPGIPQHFLFSELLWSSQAAGGSKRLARLGTQAGVELTQAGRLFANDTNTASAEGYTTLALKASQGWAVGQGSLTAYARVDNLTDRRYVGSVIVNQAVSQFYEPAPGRNWTLGLRFMMPL